MSVKPTRTNEPGTLPVWAAYVAWLALGLLAGFVLTLAVRPIGDAGVASAVCPTPVCDKAPSQAVAPIVVRAPVVVRGPVGGGGIRQIGFLRPDGEAGRDRAELRPLFGAPSAVRRGRWYYHTIASGLEVPVLSMGRDCSDEVGCEQLSTGDVVEVGGIGERAVVQLYEAASYTRNRH